MYDVAGIKEEKGEEMNTLEQGREKQQNITKSFHVASELGFKIEGNPPPGKVENFLKFKINNFLHSKSCSVVNTSRNCTKNFIQHPRLVVVRFSKFEVDISKLATVR